MIHSEPPRVSDATVTMHVVLHSKFLQCLIWALACVSRKPIWEL